MQATHAASAVFGNENPRSLQQIAVAFVDLAQLDKVSMRDACHQKAYPISGGRHEMYPSHWTGVLGCFRKMRDLEQDSTKGYTLMRIRSLSIAMECDGTNSELHQLGVSRRILSDVLLSQATQRLDSHLYGVILSHSRYMRTLCPHYVQFEFRHT